MVKVAHDSGSFVSRTLFAPEHDAFRDSARKFVEVELVPYHAEWEKNQMVSREAWEKAGAAGMLCPNLPEAYGGFDADWLYNVVVIEELARAGMSGPGFSVHSDIVAPYIFHYGSEDLKREWLPKLSRG